MHTKLTRREALAALAVLSGARPLAAQAEAAAPAWKVATFQADVTPPPGHPLLGGHFQPSLRVADPLLAKGVVLFGGGEPIVVAAVDWCELRNDAYARWRAALADAAGTTIDRVLVCCVHQHDAPYADLTAQRLLASSPLGGLMIDLDFHERAVQAAAQALRASLGHARPLTHLGLGQAQVAEVASNRRVVPPGGKPTFRRYSTCRDAALRDLPEGTIDPWLKTISFWCGETPLAALSAYACHPMSYYGQGEISGDFVAAARQRRQQDAPGVFQVYASGCSGDVTAGKYNDGARENRPVLAERLYRAMVEAWKATKRQPLSAIACRSVPILLPHSELPTLAADALRRRLETDARLYGRIEAALGLSSLERNPDGHVIDVQAVDLGPAQIVLLPAESFVAFQLQAQKLRPEGFVVCLGFGECAPGYLPTDEAFGEGYREEHGYCWVRPGAEGILAGALGQALAR